MSSPTREGTKRARQLLGECAQEAGSQESAKESVPAEAPASAEHTHSPRVDGRRAEGVMVIIPLLSEEPRARQLHSATSVAPPERREPNPQLAREFEVLKELCAGLARG